MSEVPQSPPALEKTQSIASCVTKGVGYFVILSCLFLCCTFVIPKFKDIFTDMLGGGESLPKLTARVIALSDYINKNFPFFLNRFLFFSLVSAGFIGSKELYLPKKVCKWIDNCFIIVCGVIFLIGTIAMFLPLNKLGQ